MIVMVAAVLVNGLLLTATGLLLGEKPNLFGILGGSLLWGLLAVLSLYPSLRILGTGVVRLCAMAVTALLTFGFHRSSIRNVLIFVFLHLSVTGITQSGSVPGLLLCFLCIFIVYTGKKGKNLIPVELSYGGKTLTLTALRDTGNTLRDPVTGRQVLIVEADIAGKLTGLTPADLQDPVNTMGAIPGLRLIPYKTVGNTGFLLGLNIAQAKIGNRQGSAIVAFSPHSLGTNFQALTGGTV